MTSLDPTPAAGQEWQDKHKPWRYLTIESVSNDGETVWPRRSTSRRRQSMTVRTLHKGYRRIR